MSGERVEAILAEQLPQRLAVGWTCDHDFTGATCEVCFSNISHATKTVLTLVAAETDGLAERLRAAESTARDEINDACPHEPDEHAEGTCEVCDFAFAADSIVQEAFEFARALLVQPPPSEHPKHMVSCIEPFGCDPSCHNRDTVLDLRTWRADGGGDVQSPQGSPVVDAETTAQPEAIRQDAPAAPQPAPSEPS